MFSYWHIIWFALLALVFLFGFVLLFGAPYVPTLKRQTAIALDMLDLKPGQTLLELGCGDGRVLLAAAGRGLKVVGYELNPLLALIAWLRTRRHDQQVRVIWGNFWIKPWPPADAVFVFLLDKYMKKLDKKVIQYNHKPVKLVSFAFKIPGRAPVQQKDGLFLYTYE